MKIHIVESIELNNKQKKNLEKLGEVKYFEGMPNAEELLERIEGADIVVANWSPIDKIIPKIKPGLKLISVPFTGVGFLPLEKANKKGIKIANAPGYGTESVGEFGVGLMLSLIRKIYSFDRNKPKPKVEICLYGKTIGILGEGRIGKYVGKVSKALGMNVIYFTRNDDLNSVLKKSDVIYCSLPLTEKTKNLLGKKEFNKMKKGSFFVTTSHNEIYDHNALLNALNKNLEGAALDLEGITCGDYDDEVYKKFKNHPKIIVTPHIAFKTDYAIKKGKDIMIKNIENFLNRNPTNIVN